LEEATRDAATGVELLLVVHRQREEVLPFARGLVGHGADQQHGAVALDHDGAARLARDLAGFERDVMVAVLEGLGDFRHVGIPWMLSETETAAHCCAAVVVSLSDAGPVSGSVPCSARHPCGAGSRAGCGDG